MDQGGDITGLGRRAGQRIFVRVPAAVVPQQTQQPYRVAMRDLSSSGTRIVSKIGWTPGHELEFALKLAEGQPVLRARAEVSWCSPLPQEQAAGTHVAGLRFQDLPEEDEKRLAAFIDQHIWNLLTALSQLSFFQDFNDLERMLLASICFCDELEDGQELDPDVTEGSLIVVRSGNVLCARLNDHGNIIQQAILQEGDLAGGIPHPLRTPEYLRILAQGPASLVGVSREGYLYLQEMHREVSAKLFSAYCLGLENRCRDLEFALTPVS
jgi:hypothetical protein